MDNDYTVQIAFPEFLISAWESGVLNMRLVLLIEMLFTLVQMSKNIKDYSAVEINLQYKNIRINITFIFFWLEWYVQKMEDFYTPFISDCNTVQ